MSYMTISDFVPIITAHYSVTHHYYKAKFILIITVFQ
jgi:hypothetical protein